MPAFDWMFQVVDSAPPGVTPVVLPKVYAPTHGVVVPRHDAQALVAYVLALKQPPFPDADASTATIADAGPTGARASAAAPRAGGYDAAKGQALFTATC